MSTNRDHGREGPDVLLVNPWIYDFAAYDLWARPLGLLYLAAVLRENGYRVHLIDCLRSGEYHPGKRRSDGRGTFPKQILPKPAAYAAIPRRYGRYGISEEQFRRAIGNAVRPAAILVTSGMTYWYPGVFRAIELLREHFPDVTILLGGIYATLCPDHAGSYSGADQVITGPGETAALQAVDAICGRDREAGRCLETDALPFPAFDLYHHPDSACLLTSRGCSFRCTYCATHLLSPGFGQRSPENVLAEIEWLRRGLGIRNLAFYDDSLLAMADRHIKPILEDVIRNGLDCLFHTPNGLHVRLVDRELSGLMFRAGFRTIRLSLETADQTRQERQGFKASRDDLVRALDHLSAVGFPRGKIGVYLLAGLPGQEAKEISASAEFVTGLGARAELAFYSPIPGTVEWDRAVLAGLVSPGDDPLRHNNTTLAYRSTILPAEKLEAVKRAIRETNRSLLTDRRLGHGMPERSESDGLQLHL